MHVIPASTVDGYVEQLRRPDLSFGTYRIPAGGVDPQSPHTEDELYVIASGSATFIGDDTGAVDAVPGTILFVPAGEGHRFVDIREDLVALVFFGPAEGSRA